MTTTTEHRVTITDRTHVWQMGTAAGLAEAVELLEALPATIRGTPGVALAIATISAEANAQRGALSTTNLIAVAKAGLPIERYKRISFDPRTSELIGEFYDPDLFDSTGGES